MNRISSPRRAARAGLALLAAALAPALGCRPAGQECVRFDFAAGFAQATVRAETRRVDFGTAPARASLLAGWSSDETWDGGTTVVWGEGPRSELRVFRFAARPTRLRLRGQPVLWTSGQPQVVTVAVNGREVGSVRLAPELAGYELAIPAAALRTGENRLELRYSRFEPPPAVPGQATDPRPLAVAWDWLALDEMGGAASQEAASPLGVGEEVSLPFRSRVDYAVEVRPGSRIRIDEVRPWGGGEIPPGTALQVRIAPEEGPAQSLAVDPAVTSRGLALDVPAAREGLARISFTVLPGPRQAGTAAGLTLVRPALVDGGVCAAPAPPPLPPSGGEALAAVPAGSAVRTAAASPAPNLIVYLVDTLRADHLGTYGYRRPVSPRLDALAARSVVFERAYAQSGWTKTSVASILSGLSPFGHGVLDRPDVVPPDLALLPDLLRARGYESLAVLANGTVAAEFGFARHFDREVPLYALREESPGAQRADRVVGEFFRWLGERRGKTPFFAFLHTVDPHDPYEAPEAYRGRFAPRPRTGLLTPRHDEMAAILARRPELSERDLKSDLESRYDAEIAFNDAQLGILLDGLARRGLYESTLIVFVSDHGEEFLDHGYWGHGHSLYEEILHVPLVVKLPGSRPLVGRIAVPVQHVDLVPTLLEAAGMPVPADLPGASLLPLMRSGAAAWPGRALISLLHVDAFRLVSVVAGDRHLVSWDPERPESRLEVYDLAADPRERRPLTLPRNELWADHLLGLLREGRGRWQRATPAPRIEIAGETAERLRALGYLR